jgi:hypothetical protein
MFTVHFDNIQQSTFVGLIVESKIDISNKNETTEGVTCICRLDVISISYFCTFWVYLNLATMSKGQ